MWYYDGKYKLIGIGGLPYPPSINLWLVLQL